MHKKEKVMPTIEEQLIKAIINNDAQSVGALIEHSFSGSGRIANEALFIAVDNKSFDCVPVISKYLTRDKDLSLLYSEINKLENHLDYAAVFSSCKDTVCSENDYATMKGNERVHNLEMMMTNYPSVFDDAVPFTTSFLSDDDELRDFSDFAFSSKDIFSRIPLPLRVAALSSAMEQKKSINRIDELFGYFSDVDFFDTIEAFAPECRKSDYVPEILTRNQSICNVVRNAVACDYAYSEKTYSISTVMEKIIPAVRKHFGEDAVSTIEYVLAERVTDNNLFCDLGVKIIARMINEGEYREAHQHYLRNAKKLFRFSRSRDIDDESMLFARQIADILIAHKSTLDKASADQLYIAIHNELSEFANDGKMTMPSNDKLVDVVDLLLLNDMSIVSNLLPEKRKCPLKSAISNTETQKWSSLAYYFIAKNYDFKTAVYAYTKEGLKNTQLAAELLALYRMTPLDALQVLTDDNSQETLTELLTGA